jgi:hypothetical protein
MSKGCLMKKYCRGILKWTPCSTASARMRNTINTPWLFSRNLWPWRVIISRQVTTSRRVWTSSSRESSSTKSQSSSFLQISYILVKSITPSLSKMVNFQTITLPKKLSSSMILRNQTRILWKTSELISRRN